MASRSKSKASKKVDPEDMPPLSQASSDDGMAAVLVQKLHTSMEKKKKQKETKFFAAYQKEVAETNARSALEFNDYCDQIDRVFEDFSLEYAKAEDDIRSIWVKIIKAHAPFTAHIQELLEEENKRDKEREEQQVLGIAYHKKSEETLERIATSLLELEEEEN